MKQSKGRIKNIETNTVNLDFGTYGLTVLESSRISAAQLEAVRRVLARKMKRMGKIFFRVTADRGVSGKPAEVRMGKGKLYAWAGPVKEHAVGSVFQLLQHCIAVYH